MTQQEILKTHLQESQFITPSYTLYEGLSGFQDYGILGFIVRNKLINLWRNHFLFHDDIYEVETPILMSHPILKASGHIDRFTDYVVYDYADKCHRADHVVKFHLKDNGKDTTCVDSMSMIELEKYINDHKLVLGKPVNECKNDKGDTNMERHNVIVTTKNLMLKADDLYLRPELAQGIFVNFKKYLDFHKNKLPFAIAQLGKSFRREISPQQFIRLREFTQFEIEYFFDPINPIHNNFKDIKHIILPLLSSKSQIDNNLSLEYITADSAVTNGVICNQILAYYLARILLFTELIGLDKSKIRFRQHLPLEKAHYCSDCWDLECFIDGNWLECVGCANRQSYDLKAHSSTQALTVRRDKRITKIKPLMNIIHKTYKSNANILAKYLKELNQLSIVELKESIKTDNVKDIFIGDIKFTITDNMIEFYEEYDDYYPHIIEPSFGIDRIMYALFSHNFYKRIEDEQRIVLSLKQSLAPYDIAIIQISNDEKILKLLADICVKIKSFKLSCYTDSSSVAIGKRYARIDKIGIKYTATIDFDSLLDNKITLRERDSMTQIRINIDDLYSHIT